MITQKTMYEMTCDICGRKEYIKEMPSSQRFSGRFNILYVEVDPCNSTKQAERAANMCANCYAVVNTAINSIPVVGD